jgi:hypothetical protein
MTESTETDFQRWKKTRTLFGYHKIENPLEKFNELNELYEFHQPDTKTINEFKLKEACVDMGIEMPERIEGYEYV